MSSIFMSFLSWKAQQEARYRILSTQGPFELRMYQRMVCAKLAVTASCEEALNYGIKHLNDYLEGNNFKVTKIQNSGPFFQVHKTNAWEIGIILPQYSYLETPKPINRSIRIEEIPPGKVGILRYKGITAKETFLRRGEDLKKWLNLKGLSPIGAIRISRHDLTIPFPFFKYNEVHLDVL